MKKILVTGGAGFIGSSVVKKLVQMGYEVKVFDNFSRGKEKTLKDIIDKKNLYFGDIRDLNKLDNAIKNCDTVIHLAYINGTKYFYSKPYQILDVGIKGCLNVLDLSRKYKIKNLFLASTSEVYAIPQIIPTPEDIQISIPDILNPRFSYAGGKIASELLFINYKKNIDKKANIKIFRPHNVYGPNMGNEHVIPELIKKIKVASKNRNKECAIQGSGRETRSFIYIDDFTEAFSKVLLTKNKDIIFNIGNNEEISILNLAKKISQQMNIKLKFIKSDLRLGGTPRRCPQIKKIKKLGYKQQINLDYGLSKTINWYLNN